MSGEITKECDAYGCENWMGEKSRSLGITFHRISREALVKRGLMLKTRPNSKILSIAHTSLLCSVHFKPQCLNRSGEIVRLNPGSFPTEFMQRGKQPKSENKSERRNGAASAQLQDGGSPATKTPKLASKRQRDSSVDEEPTPTLSAKRQRRPPQIFGDFLYKSNDISTPTADEEKSNEMESVNQTANSMTEPRVSHGKSSCSVIGCSNSESGKRTEKVSFHRFPTDSLTRSLWKMALRLKSNVNLDATVVCAKHFPPACFYETSTAVRLRNGSIPTLAAKRGAPIRPRPMLRCFLAAQSSNHPPGAASKTYDKVFNGQGVGVARWVSHAPPTRVHVNRKKRQAAIEHLFVKSGQAESPRLSQQKLTEETSSRATDASKKNRSMNGSATPKRTSASSTVRSTGKASKNLESSVDVGSASRSDGDSRRRNALAHADDTGAASGTKRKNLATEEDVSHWTSELALAKRLSLSMAAADPTASTPPPPSRNAAGGKRPESGGKANRSTGTGVAKQVNGRVSPMSNSSEQLSPRVAGSHLPAGRGPAGVTRLAQCVREPSDDTARVRAKILFAMQHVQEQDKSIKELHESFKTLSAQNDDLRQRCKQLTELAVSSTRLTAATTARIARGGVK